MSHSLKSTSLPQSHGFQRIKSVGMSSLSSISPALIALPREIRDLILTYTFSPPYHSDATLEEIDHCERPAIIMNFLYCAHDYETHFECLPYISKTSMQLYWEATPIWLSRVTLEINDLESLHWTKSWLERFGPKVFDVVPNLILSDYNSSNFVAHREFMVRFKNLRELDIVLSIEHLEPRDDIIVRVQAAVDVYQLETIAQMPSLMKLSFTWVDGTSFQQDFLSRHLRSYFEEKFGVQGRRDVEIDRGYETIDDDSDSDPGCSWFD